MMSCQRRYYTIYYDLYRIWDSHSSGGYEKFHLLEYNAVYPLKLKQDISEKYLASIFRVKG
jgi:hypothetical protein